MSSLPQDVLIKLIQVLAQLASPDNAVRATAEDQLDKEWMLTMPDTLLTGLAFLSRNNSDPELRAFAAVLTRRVAFKSSPNEGPTGTKTVWESVQEETRVSVRTHYLAALTQESDRSVRNRVCDTISELAHSTRTKLHPWPEVYPAVYNCTQSTTRADLREAGYRIMNSSPSLLSGQSAEAATALFNLGLQDGNLLVRLSAIKATVSFIQDTNHDTRSAMDKVMMPMMESLAAFRKAKYEVALVEAVSSLIELAERAPRLFRHIVTTIPILIEMAEEKTLEDQTRQVMLELMVTLAECSPSWFKRVPDFVTRLVPVSLEMMTELEDEAEWYMADDQEEEETDTNTVIGEQAIDRLSRALGGKVILPVIFGYIPKMLANEQDWKTRHAGLMAISAMGEGCGRVMEGELTKIVHMVVPFLRDSHARVRFAACHTIGQMATDFAGPLQKNHHAVVLTNLIPVMDDAPYPRIRSHAAAALVNFCEDIDKSTLGPYLDAIFDRLLSLLSTGTTFVQEQAITTMAAVADSAGDKFLQYYSRVMPLLMSVLRQATSSEYRLLRGKAMECGSLIALAVGKEVFAPHVQEFIKLLVQTQTSLVESDDPQTSYLLAAWARVCKVLGPDFVPYLDIVMPPLLTSARLKPDLAVLDPEEDVESKYAAEDGWEFVGVDGQHIGIKTTVLEEKCTAIEMLICYARELGPGFRPYLEQVREIVLPLLRFYFHDGVRHAAVATLPHLVSCAQQAQVGQEYLVSYWFGICVKVLEVMATEKDASFLLQLYTSFYECLDALGSGPSLNTELLEAFTRATDRQLREQYSRLKRREEDRAANHLDAEEKEQMDDEETTEEAVLAEIARGIFTVLKTHGVGYMGHFRSLEPILATYLGDTNAFSRQWAIGVLDDLVEFTGPHSWPIMVPFLPQILNSVMDPQAPEVRQAACYGLGLCGQFGGAPYAELCSAALSPLFQVIHEPGSRTTENIFVTENAISAVTKICKFNNSHFDINTVLPSWVQTLPILHDEEEAPQTYSYMLDLLESQHPAVLGLNNVNMPHLVTVMVEALVAGLVPEPTQSRMVYILKAALSTLDAAITTTLWNSIAPEKRKTLQDLHYV
ncbi:MAG: importin subunit beta-3 [Linnemannia gamsii]|nr:MAG: importin subunit beta-3 [Linnemannia gamsii]